MSTIPWNGKAVENKKVSNISSPNTPHLNSCGVIHVRPRETDYLFPTNASVLHTHEYAMLCSLRRCVSKRRRWMALVFRVCWDILWASCCLPSCWIELLNVFGWDACDMLLPLSRDSLSSMLRYYLLRMTSRYMKMCCAFWRREAMSRWELDCEVVHGCIY
jgi:hypothetical protein